MNVPVLVAGIFFGMIIAFRISVYVNSRVIREASEKHNYNLASRKKRQKTEIVSLAEETSGVSIVDIQRLLGVSAKIAKKYLDELVKEQVLVKVGRYYKLT